MVPLRTGELLRPDPVGASVSGEAVQFDEGAVGEEDVEA